MAGLGIPDDWRDQEDMDILEEMWREANGDDDNYVPDEPDEEA